LGRRRSLGTWYQLCIRTTKLDDKKELSHLGRKETGLERGVTLGETEIKSGEGGQGRIKLLMKKYKDRKKFQTEKIQIILQ